MSIESETSSNKDGDGKGKALEPKVIKLAQLEESDTKLLESLEVFTEEDLSYLKFEDLPSGLHIVKKRKMETISNYLQTGKTLTDSTTMKAIQKHLTSKTNPKSATQPTGGGNPQSSTKTSSLKISTNPLPEFSGDPWDFEAWQRTVKATLGQASQYIEFLTRAPLATNNEEISRNKELFHMISAAVSKSHALNIIEKVESDKGCCGHSAWTEMVNWYMDPTRKDAMVMHWESQLDNLSLDTDTTATEYINKFERYVRNIEILEGTWTDYKKVREFRKRIVDEGYETELRTCKKTYDDLIKVVRAREQDLIKEDIIQGGRPVRRFQAQNAMFQPNSGDANETPSAGNIPYLPTCLMQVLDPVARKNILTWRKLSNAGRKISRFDFESGDTSDVPVEKGKDTSSTNKTKKKKGSRNRRLSTVVPVGLPDSAINITIKDSSQILFSLSNLICSTVFPSYDSHLCLQHRQDLSALPASTLRRTGSRGMSAGHRKGEPYSVVDSGASVDMVGGLGWKILHVSEKKDLLLGALAGMGTCTLPRVDAVTCLTDVSGKTVLIGMGDVSWDQRQTQIESLWNSHHLRNHGVKVNDVSRHHGGSQDLIIPSPGGGKPIKIPMIYDGDIMTVPLHEPTDAELHSLDIVWLLPSSNTQIASTIRRKKLKTKDTREVRFREDVYDKHIRSDNESEINVNNVNYSEEEHKKSIDRWKACLAYPTDKVLEGTLKFTTQLQQEPVEMENREFPRQHRKKRLPSLHVTRIPGRVDSDTFFSTVTSKRKYSCVQLFVCTLSKFIFVRCLQCEKQSHAAYEDFIREIRAPSLLCTDNAKTQTGEMWTATSRKFQIQQRITVPHNQNQNHAERSIQEIKHNTMRVLYETNAPLEFWCYCLIFVVDCYNHTAKASINDRVPVQVLRGDTPDISAFRYHFWQEIDYFEPRAKSPLPNGNQDGFSVLTGTQAMPSHFLFGLRMRMVVGRKDEN